MCAHTPKRFLRTPHSHTPKNLHAHPMRIPRGPPLLTQRFWHVAICVAPFNKFLSPACHQTNQGTPERKALQERRMDIPRLQKPLQGHGHSASFALGLAASSP